jgi:serine/threonine-protein kinase HipA
VWLPGAGDPVVAGRLDVRGGYVTFTYGRSYLDRADRISLYEPELPLVTGSQVPEFGPVAGCISDAGPDSWGRRLIAHRRDPAAGTDLELQPIVYLLGSGADRIGGLDFQTSPDEYRPREHAAVPLVQLLDVADRIERGLPVPRDLELALLHGTSVGGARPKAHLDEAGRPVIAKFSSSTDERPVVKSEYLAMALARRAGLDVAPVTLTRAAGKDVLLVERFDRPEVGRRLMVSARTILRLGELGVGGSYADLADVIRARFTEPEATLRELFSRVTFNILVGNTDDHARNHAAFWDGAALTLTPAFDICPQARVGGEATQAMAIGADGFRLSQIAGCIERAGTYRLSGVQARAIVDHQIQVITEAWRDVCDEADLSSVDREGLWQRQFLNPFALHGY